MRKIKRYIAYVVLLVLLVFFVSQLNVEHLKKVADDARETVILPMKKILPILIMAVRLILQLPQYHLA
mgnify:CR=1 FL=1